MKILLTTMIGVALVLQLVGFRTASTHEWYEAECCSGKDCRPVPSKDVRENADGTWTYLPEGVHFTVNQVRRSKDARVHVCYVCQLDESGRRNCWGRCLYLPDLLGV